MSPAVYPMVVQPLMPGACFQVGAVSANSCHLLRLLPDMTQGFTNPGSIALSIVRRNAFQGQVISWSPVLQSGTKIGDFSGGDSSVNGIALRICSKLCARK